MLGELSERTQELLDKFGKRLHDTHMTLEGLPSEDEVVLIKDIWFELTGSERNKICDALLDDISQGDSELREKLPWPEAYAMRLTFKYLTDLQEEELLSDLQTG